MPLEIRHTVGYDDLQRWVETFNATSTDTMTTQGRAFVHARELDSVDLLALEDDEAVGVAFLAGDPRSRALERPWCDVRVQEQHRGHGVGSALLMQLVSCATTARRKGLRCSADADDASSLAFLAKRGFTITRVLDEMSIELDCGIPIDPEPPFGSRCCDWPTTPVSFETCTRWRHRCRRVAPTASVATCWTRQIGAHTNSAARSFGST